VGEILTVHSSRPDFLRFVLRLALLPVVALSVFAQDGALVKKESVNVAGLASPLALAADGSVYFGTRRTVPGGTASLMVLRNGVYSTLFTCSDDVDTAPAIGADGTLYFGSWNGHFYAVSPAGVQKWEFDVGHFISSSAALGVDGTVYFGAGDGCLHALAANGVEKWRFQSGGWVESSPAVNSYGVIFAGSWDGNCYAIDTSGAQMWKSALGGHVVASPALSKSGSLFVCSTSGVLRALNQETGATLWETKLVGSLEAGPVLDSLGHVIVGGSNGLLASVDAGTGVVRWQKQFAGPIMDSATIRSDGSLLVVSGNTLYCISAAGVVQWNHVMSAQSRGGVLLSKSYQVIVTSLDGVWVSLSSSVGLDTASDWPMFRGQPGGNSYLVLPFKAPSIPAVSVRLTNVSVRAFCSGVLSEDPVLGFTVGGKTSVPMLLRAVGPTLGLFGVSSTLADPALVLNQGSGVIGANDNWQQTSEVVAASMRVGAFSLPAGSVDASMLALLEPGGYTIGVEPKEGQSGVVLLEGFDASTDKAAHLSNFSVRSKAGEGDHALHAGFVIEGTQSLKVLVRAIGPTLKAFGLANALEDPLLQVYQAGLPCASNDDWALQEDASSLRQAMSDVGAFSLADSSKDACLFLVLSPGAYTCSASAKAGRSGVALLEVYAMP